MKFCHLSASTIKMIEEKRITGHDQLYGGSEHGSDFYLHIPYVGTIIFDNPEEAEAIAGAILSGLKKERLPRRKVIDDEAP